MQRFMTIALLFVTSLCNAAAHDGSWDEAVQRAHEGIEQGIVDEAIIYLPNENITHIPANLNMPEVIIIDLSDNEIEEIPIAASLPLLSTLTLEGNHIDYVNPQILNQFPELQRLYLNRNPIAQANVDELRKAAEHAGRDIEISADDIGDAYLPPDYAKRLSC